MVLIAFTSKSHGVGLRLRAEEVGVVTAGLSLECGLTSSLVWERKRGFERLVLRVDIVMAAVVPVVGQGASITRHRVCCGACWETRFLGR